MRRHPHPTDLAAWFDGEGVADIGRHVLSCHRCRRRADELARVRAAVRGEPLPAAHTRTRLAWRPSLAPVALGLVLVLVAANSWDPLNERIEAAGRYLTGQEESPSPSSSSTTTTTAAARPPAAAPSAPAVSLPADRPPTEGPVRQESANAPVVSPGRSESAPPTASPSPAPAIAPEAPSAEPLRLGAFVPTRGLDAGEGRQVTRALRRAVEAANEAGGVAGRPIELVVEPAEDAEKLARLAATVDVLVGGFGAPPPDKPGWFFPADPHAAGPGVVPAELSTLEVGSRLAADLAARGVEGTVGVVLGEGPERALAEGLARQAPVSSIEAKPDTTCDRELFALRRRQVVALAIAGPPELAARCADARARLAWRLPGGLLLAPSAAYAHLGDRLTAQGARTVLGLPWPTGDSPGAARYRSAVPGPPSYRALVSYAAVELALQVARARGSVTPEDATAGRWSSDLFDLPERAGAAVVEASLGRWMPPRSERGRFR